MQQSILINGNNDRQTLISINSVLILFFSFIRLVLGNKIIGFKSAIFIFFDNSTTTIAIKKKAVIYFTKEKSTVRVFEASISSIPRLVT